MVNFQAAHASKALLMINGMSFEAEISIYYFFFHSSTSLLSGIPGLQASLLHVVIVMDCQECEVAADAMMIKH